MRLLTTVLGLMASLASVFLASPIIASAQQNQSASELFEKLRAPETSNDAADRLDALADRDPRVKHYLANHLPTLIEDGPQHYQPPQPESAMQYPGPVWLNAVKLAKDQRIAQTAPSLCKWITVRNGGAMLGLSADASLENNPAGRELVQIGDPAVPSLKQLLAQGKLEERADAMYALTLIGSPNAKNALRDHVTHESDENLKARIEKFLANGK